MTDEQTPPAGHVHKWQPGMEDILFSCEECVLIVNARARDRIDALEALARDVAAADNVDRQGEWTYLGWHADTDAWGLLTRARALLASAP